MGSITRTDTEIVAAMIRSPHPTAAAERLGISQTTVWRRLQKPAVRLALSRALERAGLTYDAIAQKLKLHLEANKEDPADYVTQGRALETYLRLVDAYPDKPPAVAVQVNQGNPYAPQALGAESDEVLVWASEHGRLPTEDERREMNEARETVQELDDEGEIQELE